MAQTIDMRLVPTNWEKFGRDVWENLRTIKLSTGDQAEEARMAIIDAQARNQDVGADVALSGAEDAAFNEWADRMGL